MLRSSAGRSWAVGLLGAALVALAGRPTRAAADAGPLPSAGSEGDSRAKAEAEAAAAQQAAASLEAQVIELRRSMEALERERAAFDDLRGRLDAIDARLAEDERQAGAAPTFSPSDARSIRFQDHGFTIRSPDGRLLVRPHVRVQAIYTGAVADTGPADLGVAADQSSFALAHAEVILEGHAVSPAFEYRLQVDGATPQILEDAFVQWRFLRSTGVRAGQFKIPYGLQNLYWTAELEFVDVSAATAAFAPGWDLGAMVVSRPIAGRLEVQAGLFNGAGPNAVNENLDLAYAARVVAAPFGPLPPSEGDVEWHASPRMSVGVSGFYNLVPTDILLRFPTDTAVTDDINGDHRRDNVGLWQGGVELRAVWRGAAVQAEGFSRLEDPGAAGPNRTFWGGYVQASYFILPHRLQVGARIGRTDLPLYGVPAAVRQARGDRTDEQSAVVGGYLFGYRAKAQVDYSHLASENANSAPSVHRVRAAVQLAF